MKITIYGSGYVGLVTGTCLAELEWITPRNLLEALWKAGTRVQTCDPRP